MNFANIFKCINSPADGHVVLCIAVVALALKDCESGSVEKRESALSFLNSDDFDFYKAWVGPEMAEMVESARLVALASKKSARLDRRKVLDGQMKILLDNYSRLTCRQLGEMLGLSQVNVYNRLRQMGLSAKKCTQEYLSELHSKPRRKMYEKLSDTKRSVYE